MEVPGVSNTKMSASNKYFYHWVLAVSWIFCHFKSIWKMAVAVDYPVTKYDYGYWLTPWFSVWWAILFMRVERIRTKTLILMMVEVTRRKMAEARRGRTIPGMAGRSSHLKIQFNKRQKNVSLDYFNKFSPPFELTNLTSPFFIHQICSEVGVHWTGIISLWKLTIFSFHSMPFLPLSTK